MNSRGTCQVFDSCEIKKDTHTKIANMIKTIEEPGRDYPFLSFAWHFVISDTSMVFVIHFYCYKLRNLKENEKRTTTTLLE
jgi:hypothetical protein